MTDRNSSTVDRVTVADLRETQIALLRQIAHKQVTWRADMLGACTYRLWKAEDNYTIVTDRITRLLDLGLCRDIFGYVLDSGTVELTADGKRLAR